MACCIDSEKLDHGKGEIYEALGLARDDKDKVEKVLQEAINRRRISEMIEHIWVSKCGDLTLEEKVYATFRLGMEIYALLLDAVIKSKEAEEVEKAGEDGSKAS